MISFFVFFRYDGGMISYVFSYLTKVNQTAVRRTTWLRASELKVSPVYFRK